MYFRMCVWMMTGRLGTSISQAVHQQASFSGTSEACDDSRSCLLVAFTSPFKISHTLSRYSFGRIKNGGPLLPHLPMSSFLIEPQEEEDPCTEIQTAPFLVTSKEHIWDWWCSPRLVQSPLKPLGVCACQIYHWVQRVLERALQGHWTPWEMESRTD